KKSGAEAVAGTYTDELVIALCGPIGSPMHDVAGALQEQLEQFGYDCFRIQLSHYIEKHAPTVKQVVEKNSEYHRTLSLINAGNALREKYGPSVLANLAVWEIRLRREKDKKEQGDDSPSYRPLRACHIIDSIKNQQELDLLRSVYGEMLFVIGVFSPMSL